MPDNSTAKCKGCYIRSVKRYETQRNKNLITTQGNKLELAFELGLEADRANVNNWGVRYTKTL